MGDGDK